MKKLDERRFLELLNKMADTLIKQDPNQDYEQTEMSLDAARMTASHYNLAGSNINQMLRIRDKFEAGINKRYNANLFTGMGAFLVDTEAQLKQAGVPKQTRVISGFLDTLIAVVSIRSGFTKIVNL